MRGRRWPRLASAGLLLAASLATAVATFLHWLPCRGSMLNGSIVRGYTYGADFSDGCLRRMDTGLPFPYPPEPVEQTAWASELGVLATVLLGLAWLALVIGSDWAVSTKALAAVPGLLTLGLAGHAALATGRLDRSPDSSAPLGLWMLVEALTVVALVTVWHRERVTGWSLAAVLVVAWGSTAFGGFRQMFDYVAMATFSDANWDVPPGTGYGTAVGLLLAGAAILVLTLRRARPQPPTPDLSEPQRARAG